MVNKETSLSNVRILLVNPPQGDPSSSRPRLNPELVYIAQSIEDRKIDYRALDMGLGYTDMDLIETIDNYKPPVVWFYVATCLYKQNYERINAVKIHFPDLKIAAGGPHVSLFRDQVLKDCDGADYGAVSEGEMTAIDICRGEKAPGDIKGLFYRKSDRVVFSGERNLCEELDTLGSPTDSST